MPDHEQTSPWSRAQHGTYEPRGTTAPFEQPVPEQPAHAWVGAEPYAAPTPPAPAHPAVPAPPAYSGPPIEVRVTPAAPSGRGLAVTGVVLGSLALLGVLVVGLVSLIAFGAILDEDSGGGGGYEPLRGTIAPAAGKALTGPALAAEVTRQLRDDGEEPEGITCPDTAKVAKDVTTVCHGTDFGDEAAIVVFFEDERGSYTLLEV